MRPDVPLGPPPPFDPELAEVERLVDPVLRGATPADVPLLRGGAVPPPTDAELSRGGRFTVTHVAAPGPEGAPDVPMTVCTPAGATGLPVVFTVHGGGMVGGDHRSGLPEALDWSEAVGLVVVSVGYRLAPEHPHPAPVEDCYAGLRWTAAHAAEHGGDPARLLVAGGSAGAGIAAALALMARDRRGPALVGQLLMCPMLDDRNDTGSAVQMAGRGLWDRSANAVGWGALLGDAAGGPDVSPYASPSRATDLSGLPPAFVDVGSAETFRDEDVGYASALWRAGCSAELHVWPGGFHGSSRIVPGARISRDAAAARIAWLRRLLEPAPGTAATR